MALLEKTLPTGKGFALQVRFPGDIRPDWTFVAPVMVWVLAARREKGFGILALDESLA
jgi:hypothetical protein